MKKIQLAIVALFLGLGLASCGGNTPTTPAPAPEATNPGGNTAPVTDVTSGVVTPVKGLAAVNVVAVIVNGAPLGDAKGQRVGNSCWGAIVAATDFSAKFEKFGNTYVATLWNGSGARLNCNDTTLVIPALKEGKLAN